MELTYIQSRYKISGNAFICFECSNFFSQDCEGKSILLGVSGKNMSVYRPSNHVRINSFAWCKILRVFYKKKRFFIQLQREKVFFRCKNV